MCVITSRCNQRAAAKAEAIGGTAAEADAIREQ